MVTGIRTFLRCPLLEAKSSDSMYYIAILAPTAINEQVLSWKHFMRDHFGCIVALKSPAHITLINPFWMSSSQQISLEESMNVFSSSKKKFTIQLENFGSFVPRVIFVQVLPAPSLTQVKGALEIHLLANPSFPIKADPGSFQPHITIANRDLHKKDFITAWKHFDNKKYTASFPANGITLMKHNGLQWDPTYEAAFPFS